MSIDAVLAETRPPLGTLHSCVCTDRIQETGDVVTLEFQRTDGRRFDFLAGQFVTIRFSWDGERYARVFTIASPPTRPQRIALTIKAAANGRATRILHDHFAAGCSLEISEPGGDFTLEGRAVEKALFLCAGSGITPLMSMARALYDTGSDLDLAFIQCARTPDDVLFGQELRMLRESMLKLRVETMCSQMSGSGQPQGGGRLDVAQLARLVPDAASRTAFLCGPAGFMQAMRRHLIELAVPAERIFMESFGLEPSPANKAFGSTEAVVTFERSGVRCESNEGETILHLAEAKGVYIETSCRMGVCGTCKVKLLQGEVEMNDMGGLTEIERLDGFILSCCSMPRGDVVIDL
ncbi:iron-sulfur cluster-binding domain-containing protein [Mesorhizobium tamadayense]|uniref:Iron-sulfur cluster-binding domain-containing protein n=1 Tax=Mesorhizobium tamadayense TaxID=425306 RepID=A0A3P3F4U2_9HYPH|nr:iron-sulfur cluster-binding domain-containing protein [Mesorhizobium tamadayense]RRH93631.1 iron-sulfur cluster-binding domain-containing protein [Mesorhizobium tamadayense]